MRTVTFTREALIQLDEWKRSDPKILIKIIALITKIASSPFTGSGKPEPLKHELKGKWSRRINQEHRLVYEVRDATIIIYSCRFHYN